MKNKVILIIRDGWGYSKETKGNAVKLAKTPTTDYYERNCPKTLLKAHGEAVGLPKKTQGGSEPGHLTIGAGRVVWQPFEKINQSIKTKEFQKNKEFLKAIKHVKKYKSKLHLMGLFSDQGIHGTTEHMYELIKLAKKEKIKEVYIHSFLDGRDVPEKSAMKYFREFKRRNNKTKIATIIGRYYAMDRDTNWDRTKIAYNLLTEGKGIQEKNAGNGIKNAYKRGDSTDYYVKPIKLLDKKIEDNDAVIFWNFRSDRTRQITAALTQKNFKEFKTKKIKNLCFICMAKYDEKFKLPIAFPDIEVKNNLGNIISKNKLKQLRIAETEKYAHVTFFFNSQIEKPYKGENRILIPSPKVPSYAQKPEMSAFEVTEKLLKEIKKSKDDLIIVNFANGDLVGHSGKLKAAIKACEAVDICLSQIINHGLEKDYTLIVTADHGNAENMLYSNGEPCPAHGINDVILYIVSKDKKYSKKSIKLKKGGLSDIAPTILNILNIKKPKEMTGKSLI